jgi:hypothetical protein
MMTDGQRNDLIATMVGAIPGLSFDEVQNIIGRKGPFVSDIAGVFKKHTKSDLRQPSFLTPPEDDQEFELTIEKEIDPIKMIEDDDYHPYGWRFLGQPMIVPQTRTFRLVRIKQKIVSRDVKQIPGLLREIGYSIPEGQWREIFKKTYSRNDGRGRIGFTDFNWKSSDLGIAFPILSGDGASWHSEFYLHHYINDNSWRWLVEKK